ncbi:hypothetical protein [Leptospira andrefontaineae]|uniref:Uncharacterized protein n=1 Tax=Leptospira andrefontaineae TaxID=2484976 RepID=A0A4R9GXA9_9LEPT|nr:hypothetical protein [Leptospira andrefontaineae]TGK36274.1 hypothetical protein EHO65_18410 [Leptospira andrefontaineae]
MENKYEYPIDVFINWGSDFVKETDAEVFLQLLTPVGSIPFYREMGTYFPQIENTPSNVDLDIPASISAAQTLADYSSTARRERQALTDFNLVNISENRRTGDVDISVRYYRIGDEKFAELAI